MHSISNIKYKIKNEWLNFIGKHIKLLKIKVESNRLKVYLIFLNLCEIYEISIFWIYKEYLVI